MCILGRFLAITWITNLCRNELSRESPPKRTPSAPGTSSVRVSKAQNAERCQRKHNVHISERHFLPFESVCNQVFFLVSAQRVGIPLNSTPTAVTAAC